MKKHNPFLFLDIETGGLDPENPILSISYKRQGKRTKTLYNQPPAGSTIQKWAAENVWKPIQQHLGFTPQKTEEQSLKQFLGVLKAHRGGTLAGWNIGYVPVPMSRGSKGFDIPKLVQRAQQYGMGEEYQQAISGMNIRDIGREYSVRIAEEMTRHPEIMDPKLFKSAQSFTKLVNINKGIQRLHSIPEIAQWMGTPGKYSGYEVAGWKQKSVFKYLFGREPTNQHLSHFDIESAVEIFEKGDPSSLRGPEFARILNTEALAEKALASARAGGGSRGLEGILRAGASAFDGIGIRNLFRDNRAQLALGAVALGLFATKPLSLFSGKDDGYNTIPGLPHGGVAEKKRRQMTDFGSGWCGTVANNRGLILAGLGIFGYGYLANRREARAQELRKQLREFKTTGRFKFKGPGRVIEESGTATYVVDQDLFNMARERPALGSLRGASTEVDNFIRSLSKYPDKPGAVDLLGKLRALKETGVERVGLVPLIGELDAAERDFAVHEAMHTFVPGEIKTKLRSLSERALKEEKPKGNPNWLGRSWVEELAAYKHVHTREADSWMLAGRKVFGGLIDKTIKASLSNQELYRRTGKVVHNSSAFSGFDDEYNTLTGLPHGGLGARMRKAMTDFGSGYQGDKVYERKLRRRFGFFERALDKYGIEAGTAHKRILIPKRALTKEDIETLGFVPVSIAIPEQGQKTAISYRHPSMLYHIHEYEKEWTMHEDEHPAATMLVKKWAMEKIGKPGASLLEPIGEFFKGIPHIFEEGVPGAYYYLRGLATGAESMAERLRKDLPEEYKEQISRLKVIKKGAIASIRESIQGITNRITGKDDRWNTIEGLAHRGEGHRKRAELTDFGSGWVRKALSLGVSEAKIVTAAKQLGAGKLMGGEKWLTLNRLGQGGFGAADRVIGLSSGRTGVLKTSIKDLEIKEGQIVGGPLINRAFGKTRTQESAFGFGAAYMQKITQTAEKLGVKPFSIQYEMKMHEMARAQYGELVPEIYATGEKQFVQEYAGTSIKNLPLSEAKESYAWMKETFGKMYSEGGVAHFDPSEANITRMGGRHMIIDWGLAAPVSDFTQEQIKAGNKLLGELETSYLAERMPPSVTQPPPSIDRQSWVNNHKEAAIMASTTAKFGGKGHMKMGHSRTKTVPFGG